MTAFDHGKIQNKKQEKKKRDEDGKSERERATTTTTYKNLCIRFYAIEMGYT